MLALGFVLLIAALVLFVAEAVLPSGGLLGAGGIVALVVGTYLAVIDAGGGFALALGSAIAVGLVSGGLLALIATKTLAAMRLRASSGTESLVGRTAEVRGELGAGEAGHVFVDGALWRAEPASAYEVEQEIGPGDRVIVERVRGLTLSVRKAEEWELET